jgi:hypothetical protein
MDKASIIEKVNQIAGKQEYLARLRDKPDIGGLRLDIDQAIEELEELLDEFRQTFPDERIS